MLTEQGKVIFNSSTAQYQRARGQWAVYYTSPQSFFYNVFLFVDSTTLGTLVNFDWLVN